MGIEVALDRAQQYELNQVLQEDHHHCLDLHGQLSGDPGRHRRRDVVDNTATADCDLTGPDDRHRACAAPDRTRP